MRSEIVRSRESFSPPLFDSTTRPPLHACHRQHKSDRVRRTRGHSCHQFAMRRHKESADIALTRCLRARSRTWASEFVICSAYIPAVGALILSAAPGRALALAPQLDGSQGLTWVCKNHLAAPSLQSRTR